MFLHDENKKIIKTAKNLKSVIFTFSPLLSEIYK